MRFMSSPRHSWQTVSSKVVHTNPYYSVREDEVIRPDGSEGLYFVVEGRDSAFAVALDDEERVYLVEVDRYTTGALSIEVPAGGLDDDEPLQAAIRELKEETGITALHWQSLGAFQRENGIRRGRCHVFMATELTHSGVHAQMEEGITRTLSVPLATALTMVQRGEIADAESIAALTLVALELGRFR